MPKESIAYEKAFAFAVKIVECSRSLNSQNDYVLSKQILSSGTSIAANIREACDAQSKKDFISKMSIALKEAAETDYWIDLIKETNSINNEKAIDLKKDIVEILRILNAIIRTSKENTF